MHMMNLGEYRRSVSHLADFLPWPLLVDEGIASTRMARFSARPSFVAGSDSAVPAELVGVAGRLNNALRRLGSGWAVFVEAQTYPPANIRKAIFPDVASALVDVERRAEFEQEGAHYESNYFLTFLYLPPQKTPRARRVSLRGTGSPGKTRMLGKCNTDSSTVPTACLGIIEALCPNQMDRR